VTAALIFAAIWLAVAMPVALLIGRGIRIADDHETTPAGLPCPRTPRRGVTTE
jgi:hypothetical protein